MKSNCTCPGMEMRLFGTPEKRRRFLRVEETRIKHSFLLLQFRTPLFSFRWTFRLGKGCPLGGKFYKFNQIQHIYFIYRSWLLGILVLSDNLTWSLYDTELSILIGTSKTCSELIVGTILRKECLIP